MTRRGLDNRLRQHSRRAGLIIGVSMALTIALCVGGFAVIYAKIDPWTRDFVTAATVTPTSAPAKATKDTTSGGSASTNDGGNAPLTDTPAPEQPTQPSTGDQPTPTVAPTDTPSGFKADYKVSSDVRVNLRSGPSRDTDVVDTLDSGTELQYLNEAQPADNPAQDGQRWLKFRTQSGEEGWVREIDVSKIG